MNGRRGFLKDALMALAISLLPKTLRPINEWMAGEVPTPPIVDNIEYIIQGKKYFVSKKFLEQYIQLVKEQHYKFFTNQ